MYLGIDLGTSGVKVVLLDEAGGLCAQASAPLVLSHPHPLWSEQNPAAWWEATVQAMATLRRSADLSAVRALGLSGQMHGAVLLDRADRVLRPAILWNDGRAGAECGPLDPLARRIAGNPAMPGFTAPKLLWVRAHEPEIFAATARVLLPKDWIRLVLTGEAVSEMSDASGTLWLDVAARAWSDTLLAATHLDRTHMPRLLEGSAVSGRIRPEIAAAWGLPATCLVAGGGGDNAAGAVGIGAIAPGDAFLSLGTSGVLFVVDDATRPDPERTVHAFCHCLPDLWHRMAVILSAAASLAWITRVSGAASEAALLAEVRAESDDRLVFLPYLSGERTPHNDPAASGIFFGLTGESTRGDLARAVLEGVAFALADGLAALEARGPRIAGFSVIGGGSQSPLWGRILAAALGRPLTFHAGGEVGPALGAARLARLAAGGAIASEVCIKPPRAREQAPEPTLAAALAPRQELFRALYPALRESFARRLA